MENEIIEIKDVSVVPVTEIQERIDTMLTNRMYLIEKVKPMLIESVDIYTLPGMKKPSLGKPGAEKLASIFRLVATFIADKETIEMIGKEINGKPYVAYICNLTRDGVNAGQGRGATFIEYERTQYRNVNLNEFEAIKASLKPEDYKEAEGKYGKYYRVKDGVTFDQLALNKAIKMAEKSAFIDAVIRATGMSDLFTQDVEDMSVEIEPEHSVQAPKQAAAAPKSQTETVVPEFTKECTKCKKQHSGKFALCLDCWKLDQPKTQSTYAKKMQAGKESAMPKLAAAGLVDRTDEVNLDSIPF